MSFNEYKTNNNRLKLLIIVCVILLVLLFGIIVIFSHKSKKEYYLELSGLEEMIIYQNTEYIEPGYKAYDNQNNDYTKDVIVTGEINPNIVGEYKITYTYNNIIKERIITVVTETNQVTYLNLLGQKIIYLNIGDSYQEPGYIVLDSIDANLDNKVVIEGRVDTNRVGTYKLIYSVVNSLGITITDERTVIVMNTESNISYNPTSYTTNKVTINLNIKDNYFDYVVLPNNTQTKDRIISYEVEKNGKYTFKIYTKKGDFKEETITINNIDKTKPTGSCSGYYQDNKAYITVKAQDKESGIAKYIVDGKTYKNNQITLNSELKDHTVTIYDQVGNNILINCPITDNSKKYPRSYTKNKGSYPYMLYIPPTLSENNKLPLVIFLHGSSESGSDLNRLNNTSFPKYISKGKDYNFVMIAPQMTSTEKKETGWEATRVMSVVNDVLGKYPIDRNRIVITGFSLGGIGTYRVIKKYPGFFAGAIPVAGTNSYSDELLKTKIWAFHGSEDTNVKYDRAKSTMDEVISKNPDSKFTTLNGYGHNITEQVYTEQKVIDWIMSVRKY